MLKNRTTRVATLLLALTLITCCFVGSTFAKYTSSTTGFDTVTVAKWSFEVNGTEIAVTGNTSTPTFDLFTTGSNYDNNDNDTTDVANDRVAPGTAGSFSMSVENKSDVNAKYKVAFTVAFPAGLTADDFKFYKDSGMTQELTITDGAYIVTSEDAIAMGDAENVNVYWAWDFEGDDTAVGILAQEGNAKVTVTPTIVVEQVD